MVKKEKSCKKSNEKTIVKNNVKSNVKSNLKNIANKMKNKIAKVLFSDEFECLNCGAERMENEHFYLCKKCFFDIEFIENSCEICGDRVGSFDLICNNCKKTSHFFTKALCVAKYDGVASNLVRKLKYDNSKYLAKTLGLFMAQKLKKSGLKDIDFVVPVPLNINRIIERGFNQSELIAKVVAEECSLKVNLKLVKRVKNTPTQTSLSSSERRQNVKNAFELLDKSAVKDKNILLIDDILTTGATIDELSKLFKKHKAKNVFALTFCHA
ncbi:MAG: ComF family protein [Clostridia bacterium]|nr:ComF family protein [Clostridia bacterium]